MKFGLLSDPTFQLHRTVEHVERPERLEAVLAALEEGDFGQGFEPWRPREATDEELLSCHRQEVLDRVNELTELGGGNLDPDTYLNQHSERAARLSVGGGIDLCKAVMKGDLHRGFSLCRPPGHHATPTRSMGFCLYSTVALVAKALRGVAQRILIFDWDVHHGNGTQDCLYHHAGTRFVSFHQSPMFPGTGYPDERGEGEGEGSIYNVPLPAGCGDGEYEAAYLKIVRPLIQQYDPQLIIVSAGYDAHQKDLLGGMKVTREGFARLAQLVAEDAESCAAQGRLVGFLEGGYHLGGLAESVRATLEVWKGCYRGEAPRGGRVDDQVNRLLNQLASRYEL